jgi:hypothetical protein
MFFDFTASCALILIAIILVMINAIGKRSSRCTSFRLPATAASIGGRILESPAALGGIAAAQRHMSKSGERQESVCTAILPLDGHS